MALGAFPVPDGSVWAATRPVAITTFFNYFKGCLRSQGFAPGPRPRPACEKAGGQRVAGGGPLPTGGR